MRYFKKLDYQGHNISFNYNRNSRYKTYYGSVVTVIGFTMCFVYFIILLSQVFNFQNTKIAVSYILRDLAKGNFSDTYTNETFDYAMRLFADAQWAPTEETRMLIEDFMKNQQQYVQVTSYKFNVNTINNQPVYFLEEVELIPCPKERFSNSSNQEMANTFCPKVVEFTLSGQIVSGSGKYLELFVVPCSNETFTLKYPGSYCKSREDIDVLRGFLEINFLPKVQYFDVNDYGENPIKQTTKQFDGGVTQTTTSSLNLKMSQNIATVRDSLLSSDLNVRNYTFTQIEFFQYSVGNSDDIWFHLLLVQDQRVETIERSVFTIMQAASQIGGLIGIFTSFIFILTSGLNKLQFYAEAIQVTYKTLSINHIPKTQLEQINSMEDLKKLDTLLKPKITFFDIFKQQFQSIFQTLCRFQQCTQNSFFSKGIEKIDEELDIINVLRKLKLIEVLSKLLLTRKQRLLINFETSSIIKHGVPDEDLQEKINKLMQQELSKDKDRIKGMRMSYNEQINHKLKKLLGLNSTMAYNQEEQTQIGVQKTKDFKKNTNRSKSKKNRQKNVKVVEDDEEIGKDLYYKGSPVIREDNQQSKRILMEQDYVQSFRQNQFKEDMLIQSFQELNKDFKNN